MDGFSIRVFTQCDQEQPKQTHGDLISSLANLRSYDLFLHGCRYRIALKFGRVVLHNVWMRLAKFQIFSSKFIFMTEMNLVHSLNQEVIWLQTFIIYVWQSIIYWMRPRTAKTDCHKAHGDLISSSANLGTFDLILHDCRHRIALKLGRGALHNVWMRLTKFQTYSSKFIFMTGVNLVHSPKKVVYFNYSWSCLTGNCLP